VWSGPPPFEPLQGHHFWTLRPSEPLWGRHYVAFVPGLDYNDTTNGGNFARQRRLLTAGGVRNELILTDDWGLTDANAEVVAKRLMELSVVHKKIIVVSASKGGLETAVALGRVMDPEGPALSRHG